MYNIILDRLPTEYKGYLIRTSFRIGIQISLCLQDPDYTQEEQAYIALNLLYGEGIPNDLNLAMDGLTWFMTGDKPQKTDSSVSKPMFYWDFDSDRLYSSFMQTYGIDLAKEDMHWFRFLDLIGSLNKDSAFNQAIQIRTYDMKDLKGKARADMLKLKRDLTPEEPQTQEEKERIEWFNSLFDGGDVNG